MSGQASTGLPDSPSGRAIPVSELARQVRQSIEQAHPLQWISGEISGFTRATSGHWYFSLKDSAAQVRCAMFRGRNQWVDWQPRNGDAVEARGLPTLYEARGEFQIVVEQLRPAGQGALFEAFVRLKARLEQEGLFDAARKRPLPAQPRRIGVVTSLAAAALRDVLSTLARRAPQIGVVVYPAAVQGADAPAALLAALQDANRRADVDVLILCRGGGSLEDLWAFNDEALARAIAASALPVVSGVGHETDFTIADFAADLRAPTPTAAAELCAPDLQGQRTSLRRLGQRLGRAARVRQDDQQLRLRHRATRLAAIARRSIDTRSWALDRLAARLQHPGQALRQQGLHLVTWQQRLERAWRDQLARASRQSTDLHQALDRAWAGTVQRRQQQLANLGHALTLLDPGAVLGRGYSLTYQADGRLLRSVGSVSPGDDVRIVLPDGALQTRVLP